MNRSDKPIPWDDPAWNSDDEACSNKSGSQRNSFRKESESEIKPENDSSAVKKDEDDQNQFVQEYKQFYQKKPTKFNQNFNTDTNYQNNRGKGKFQNEWTNKTGYNNSFNDNRKKMGDDFYDRSRVQNKSNDASPDYNQRQSADARNLRIERVRNEKPYYKEFHNQSRPVNVNSDKRPNFTIVKETKVEMKNDEPFIKPAVYVNEKDTAFINGNDNEINQTIENHETKVESSETERSLNHRKPAIQIYNPATVRGKWSGLVNDPLQDVREQRRKQEGFHRNNALNNSNRSKPYSQEKWQSQGESYHQKNNNWSEQSTEPRKPTPRFEENRANTQNREFDNTFSDRPRGFQTNNNRQYYEGNRDGGAHYNSSRQRSSNHFNQ